MESINPSNALTDDSHRRGAFCASFEYFLSSPFIFSSKRVGGFVGTLEIGEQKMQEVEHLALKCPSMNSRVLCQSIEISRTTFWARDFEIWIVGGIVPGFPHFPDSFVKGSQS